MNNTKTPQHIIELARKYNVSHDNNLPINQLARKFIELSDDEYLLDKVDELLVELRKAEIITGSELTSLIIQQNKELAEHAGNKNKI